jgi:hypothetical protein
MTDYAATVERLTGIFSEARCLRHDPLADAPFDRRPAPRSRVDTEFDNVG